MRTKEQGLLTTADAFKLASLQIELRKSAHGGDIWFSIDCEHCGRLERAMNEWLAGHVASPEELEELEAAAGLELK